MSSRDLLTRLIGFLTLVVIIFAVLRIDPSILKTAVGALATLENIMNLESLYLWRERVFDTILQGLAILVGLISVLILVIWGEKHD